MDYIFEETYRLRAVDVDINGTWMPSAILTMMQEMGELHADQAGFGRCRLMEDYGICWIITRLHLVMNMYPQLGEPVRAYTWALAPTSLLFRRQFRFEDRNGSELGRASSQWALMNYADRILRRSSAIGPYPHDSEAEILLPEPKKIVMPCDMQATAKRRVRYSDVDMNGHMNNTKYLNWLCELYPTDFLRTMQIHSCRINYTSEAAIDQEVVLLTKEEDGMYVRGRTGDKSVFDAHLEWKAR